MGFWWMLVVFDDQAIETLVTSLKAHHDRSSILVWGQGTSPEEPQFPSWLTTPSLACIHGLVQPVAVRATQWYLDTKLMAITCHLQTTAPQILSVLCYSTIEAWVWRRKTCPRKRLWAQKGSHILKPLRHPSWALLVAVTFTKSV